MLQRFGRYQAHTRLAAGSMGDVYLARDVMHDDLRLAVIKTLDRLRSQGDEAFGRFAAGVRRASRLNHPSIVEVLELEERRGSPYLALEYVEGVSLSSLVRAALRSGRHSPWPLVSVLSQAARALHHAHHLAERGVPLQVVHGNLRPHNILVSLDGITKVLDFELHGLGQTVRTAAADRPAAWLAPKPGERPEVDAREFRKGNARTPGRLVSDLVGADVRERRETLRRASASQEPGPRGRWCGGPGGLPVAVPAPAPAGPPGRGSDLRVSWIP